MSRSDNKIQILRDAAEGQRCIRCANDQAVVGAHYTGARRLAYHGGLGIKVHDLAMAHLCQGCHTWMDQLLRAQPKRDDEQDEDDEDVRKWMHSEEFLHLCMMTVIRLYEQGTLIVKGQRK